MPIFEYRCLHCDHVFEMLVSPREVDDHRSAMCPKCGRRAGERLLSTFAVGGAAEERCETCPGPESESCGSSCDFDDYGGLDDFDD